MKAALQRQNSAPIPSNPAIYKPEFEGFFGFVEDQFELIQKIYKSVHYDAGNIIISHTMKDATAAMFTSQIIQCIASDPRLNIKLKFTLCEFLISVPKSAEHADSKLEEILNTIAFNTNKIFILSINKVSHAITHRELVMNTPIVEEPNVVHFKFVLSREVFPETKINGSTWTGTLSGKIDIRSLDDYLYAKLETHFIDSNFRNISAFTSTALNALSKPRDAVYDRIDAVKAFTPVVIAKENAVRRLLESVVKNNILFKSYTVQEQRAIVDAFEPYSADRFENVITQHATDSYFYIVESGELEIFVNNNHETVKVSRNVGPCDYFGELALMYNTPRAATVKAIEPCKLWRIDRKSYRSIVTYYHYLSSEENKHFLSNVQLHGRRVGDVLTPDALDKVVSHFEEETYSDGAVIIRQGNVGDSFYIIKSGNVAVWQQQMHDKVPLWVQLTTLSKGNFFGEKALLSEDTRDASCIAVGEVIVVTLNRTDFCAMLGEWADLVVKSDSGVKEAAVESISSPKSFLTEITLQDLTVLRTLGQGAFGRVKLAQHNSTKETYALKCQSKKAITKLKIEANVLNEMKLMRMINSPFVGKLHCALQDTRNIYFVLELLQGGEFFTYLQKVGRLSETKATFYAASVVNAFISLHEKKIAYRDLKPENMVLDKNGFVKIVDLGLAKQVLSGKTWTMCGTPDYLAPEIILNEGHDYSVDYWALGVLIYEMVTGWPPFYADEPMKTYEKIVACSVSYPVYVTRNMSDFVSKLLQTQPGKRLGNLKGGISDISKHKWFGAFDWTGLQERTITPPYTPAIKDSTDVSNFEKYADEVLPEESDWVAEFN